jgi:replicative DNA helicase
MIYDAQLEESILATMQYDEQSKHIFLSMLKAHHFHEARHQEAFKDIEAGKPYQGDSFNMLGGNHEYYATLLKEMHLKRMTQKGCQDILLAISNSEPMDEVVAGVESLQKDVTVDIAQKGMTIAEIEARQEETRMFEKMRCGYDYQDFYDEAGSHKGQTEVIFGHPKHGKTVYAIHRACGYLKAGYKGLFITMEDTHIKIKARIEQQLGADHPFKNEMILADRSLGARNLDDIVTFLRYHKIVDYIDFAVIDYIQRIPVKGLSARDEVQRVIEVSNRMTDMANELNLLMILLAQPHRIEKHRTGWSAFPNVEDLYGSGAIEKDAFVATAVFRPNQMDTLCNHYDNGDISTVKDWNGNAADRNSVFIKQKLNREAERSSRILHMVHSNEGLNYIQHEHTSSF